MGPPIAAKTAEARRQVNSAKGRPGRKKERVGMNGVCRGSRQIMTKRSKGNSLASIGR